MTTKDTPVILYSDECLLCRTLSWITALKPGYQREPIGSHEGKQLLKGFVYNKNQPYILDGDKLYSGRQMVKHWLDPRNLDI